jgi:UDP-N-acetylmuramoyl-L-alanyl-D-glutamate--2,6-diaminopimelate ligase
MSEAPMSSPPSWGRINRGLSLRQILFELGQEFSASQVSAGSDEVRVTGVQQDSRQIEPGDLFVARRGASHDGATYVLDALNRGAAAIMVDAACALDSALASGVPMLIVSDLARALPLVADAVYGHPAFALEVIGITGTNGKTTTSHLIRDGIDAALRKPACALIGTLGQSFAGEVFPAQHTTPEPDALSRAFRSLKQRGAEYVAMEVSSIALTLERTRAVRFRVAAFTNLTQDHLDFHGTMAAYGAAKARLFLEYGPACAVLNISDPFVRNLASEVSGPVLTVSAAREVSADITLQHIRDTGRGTALTYQTPDGVLEFETRLIGTHNAENIAVALGVAYALSLEIEPFTRSLAESPGVSGRLERCDTELDDIIVLVDYAHTPDALERALGAIRTDTRVVCVFGCGGDRDKSKRGLMGRIAGLSADLAIVTNDNPRTEDPESIAKAIVLGLIGAQCTLTDSPQASGFMVVLDRRSAIRNAILNAHPGDRILIAGKGHEDYQIVGSEKRAFSDRMVAQEMLRERRLMRNVS